MAGHSKWANIKFRKNLQDAKKGKIFTKLIREITVSARIGGEDESSNPRLRDAVVKALKANMKRDTIDNAIKRGAGGIDDSNMVGMRYEGYGPAGVAVLVDCLSDNKNRTVSEVRHAFAKFGGNLGTDGSVAYLFTKQGEILLADNQDNEAAMEVAIESGAEDVNIDNEQIEIITSTENYHAMLSTMQQAGFIIEDSQLIMKPNITVDIDKDSAETLLKMIDMLEDLDDVQEVYFNTTIPESLYT